MNLYAPYKGLPVLVTGHTGFKGAWLCSVLEKLGACWSGYALEPEPDSLYRQLKFNPPEVFHDIRDYSSLLSFVEEQKPQIIFHLAAQSLVSMGHQEPRKTFSTNVMGLVNVMEAAVKTDVKAVVVVSSDKCYLPAKTPRNIHSPLGGKEPYSASKAAAEMVLGAYRERINIIVARAGNAIGGGDWGKDRLIPDLMRALASNSPIFIRNPHASRPWQHVCELVHAYLQMGLHAMKGHHCSAWNIGPDRSATVGDILDELRRMGLSPRVVSRTNSFPENQILQLDVRETEKFLGLRSVLSWKKALSWTIEEYACIHSSSFSELIWERFCSLGSSDTSSTDSI